MPLMRCTTDKGVKGWKYGESGHCYGGPDGKKRAIKQGLAIDGPEKFKKEQSKARSSELMELMTEEIKIDLVNASISKKERDKISKDDFAWPEERKFPITSQEQVDSAAKLIGRAPASKQAAIKARIKSIAKRKGFKIPEAWTKED